MANHRSQNIRVWASEQDGPSIHMNIEVYCGATDLDALQFKQVVGRLIRSIPPALATIPYTDFGIDNISIKKVRAK